MNRVRIQPVDAACGQQDDAKHTYNCCQTGGRHLACGCGLQQTHALVDHSQAQEDCHRNAATGKHELGHWDRADGNLRSSQRQAAEAGEVAGRTEWAARAPEAASLSRGGAEAPTHANIMLSRPKGHQGEFVVGGHKATGRDSSNG